MSRLRDAIDQIIFARKYTCDLLDTIHPEDWFRMPVEGVTHVAWQVGHLAFAQFRLVLERVRGVRPEDESLICPVFIRMFGRDSVADPDPSKYQPMAEIRASFDRIHERLLANLPLVPDSSLELPPLTPHRLCRTRIECLRWCAAHEMVHAGQIALLRRLFGQRPIW